MTLFDRPMESDLAALREGEACPKVRSRKPFLNDFFRTHFVEYAFLVLYVTLTGVVMLTVIQNGVAHVWKAVNDNLSAAVEAVDRLVR